MAELDGSEMRPVVESFPSEHVKVAYFSLELPPGAVVSEHHVGVVSEDDRAGVRWAVREVDVEGFEEGAGGVRRGGDDHAVCAHLEVHDGSVFLGEVEESDVRHGT